MRSAFVLDKVNLVCAETVKEKTTVNIQVLLYTQTQNIMLIYS